MSTAARAALGAFACLLVVAAGAPGVAAQSLLSGRGFGMPFLATDARGTALGGTGIGLVGGEMSPTDPAAAARLGLPSIGFTAQASWAEQTDGAWSGEARGTRFPALALGYPARFGTVTVSLSGYLDQRWNWASTHRIELDGDGARARVTDQFQSNGGISTVRLGVARSITE